MIPRRKYAVDERKFKNCDTPEHWYWLGFLLADGCVFTRNDGREWLLQLKLQWSDRKHVERFRKFMRYEGKIRHLISPEGHESAALVIYSKALCKDLMRYGITPRKSYGHPLPIIPDKCLGDFIRGHFDGNGGIQKRTEKSYRIAFHGQRPFMEWLQYMIGKSINATHGYILTSVGCCNVNYNRRNEVDALAELMYIDDDFSIKKPCLDRKLHRVRPLLYGG